MCGWIPPSRTTPGPEKSTKYLAICNKLMSVHKTVFTMHRNLGVSAFKWLRARVAWRSWREEGSGSTAESPALIFLGVFCLPDLRRGLASLLFLKILFQTVVLQVPASIIKAPKKVRLVLLLTTLRFDCPVVFGASKQTSSFHFLPPSILVPGSPRSTGFPRPKRKKQLLMDLFISIKFKTSWKQLRRVVK